MAKEHVSIDELERSMREHGIATVHDIALAVLEVDGSISFLRYDDMKEGVHPHKKRRFLKKPE